MSSLSPAPVRSFLGGLAMALPVHALLLLNGNVFGISGFLHRAVRGSAEGALAVVGLVLGGVAIGAFEHAAPATAVASFPVAVLSGLLTGVGSKMSNGCTSGHMIAGISRFSRRSILATTIFFLTGVITANLCHRDIKLHYDPPDYGLGPHGGITLVLQAAALAVSASLYLLAPKLSKVPPGNPRPPQKPLRLLASAAIAFEFALALHLSNLSDPRRVIGFLLLPVHRLFDPSLAFLAAGVLPLSIVLYQRGRGGEVPRLGGAWGVPRPGRVNARLVSGAALFGVGWGMGGICPGPGLINLGRAVVSGTDTAQLVVWLGAVAVGGLLV